MDNVKKPRRRKDRPKKRKFHGNQFSKPRDIVNEETESRDVPFVDKVEGNDQPEDLRSRSIDYDESSDIVRSSSFKKLRLDVGEGGEGENLESDNTRSRSRSMCLLSGLRLLRLECLESFFQLFPCPMCFNSQERGKTFSISEKLNGIDTEITLTCNFCKGTMPCLKNEENMNLRFQAAMYGIGCHEKKGQRFLAAMDMPSPVSSVRALIFKDRILKATTSVAQDSMARAAHELKGAEGEKVTVACDGSWHRRGFTSKNGVATCTSVSSRVPAKVLDTETMSNYCDSCSKVKAKKTAEELGKWLESHKDACKKNHDGSAGSMEPVGIKRIFERSETLHGLKYVGYLGDGDSKSFKNVSEADPPIYNEEITKLECCGHIQKRMGKRLLDKVNQCKGKVYVEGKKKIKGIGGAGKLTKAAIKRIQGHYGGAIRGNIGNLEKMTKAIWAIWHHRKGEHKECGNWCDGSDKNRLPDFVMDEIRSVFKDLSDEKLLKKCLHGGTQNANEAFHHLIWDRCPKTTFVGKDRLQIAVYDATIVFNDGEVGRCEIFKRLGLKVGINQEMAFTALDQRRVAAAEEVVKKSSKQKRVKRSIAAAQEDSGDESYLAGGF